MIEKTVNACTRSLFNEFGDSYKYYVTLPSQNFHTPSFTADVINPLQERKHPFSLQVDEDGVQTFKKAMLYRRTMPVVLQYFPKDKNSKTECFAVAERLFNCMEEIELDGQIIRGTDLEMQIAENVLQFFVTYRFYTQTVSDDEGTFESVYTDVTHDTNI